MELTLNFILNYVLVAIGMWALLWWSIDNFKSVVQIIKSMLTPYFQPQENKSLVERYGKWAGKVENYFELLRKASSECKT